MLDNRSFDFEPSTINGCDNDNDGAIQDYLDQPIYGYDFLLLVRTVPVTVGGVTCSNKLMILSSLWISICAN